MEVENLVSVEIKSARKVGEMSAKKIDEKKREKEILTRKIGGSEKATSLIFDLTKVNENSTRNLQNEMAGFMGTVKKQRETIEQLVQERERHEQEVEIANSKHYTAIEELKLQEVQVSDLQKKIIDGQSRLKQQQNLYEAVRSDRNLYSKNLIESQEEIAEMKRRFKVMNHQIEQLKVRSGSNIRKRRRLPDSATVRLQRSRSHLPPSSPPCFARPRRTRSPPRTTRSSRSTSTTTTSTRSASL